MIRKLITTSLMTAIAVCASPLFSAEESDRSQDDQPRIVSASNPLTQIVSALDREDLFVGLDKTSHTKPAFDNIPDIGYRIQLSTEGILSLKPSLILLAHDSGPANVIEQLRKSHVEIIQFPELTDVESIQKTVAEIAQELNLSSKGDLLNQKVAQEAHSLDALSKSQPRLNGFFVLQEGNGQGSLQISGAQTGADKLLELININNLFAQDFINYRAVTLENQIQVQPNVVLIGQRIAFDPETDAKAEVIPPFRLREEGMKGWPKALQPACVFDVNMSNYLVYGIHIFEESEKLLTAIHQCIANSKSS